MTTQQKPPDDGYFDLLGVKEAAKALHISPETVRRIADKRQVRFMKVCGRLLFYRHDLVAFLDAHTTDKLDLSGYESVKA